MTRSSFEDQKAFRIGSGWAQSQGCTQIGHGHYPLCTPLHTGSSVVSHLRSQIPTRRKSKR